MTLSPRAQVVDALAGVDLASLSDAELHEARGILELHLADKHATDGPNDNPYARAVSVRAAYAFGDWPPRADR